MKLLYQKPKYLRYAKRKQRRALRRLRSRRRDKRKANITAQIIERRNRPLKQSPVQLSLPQHFSIGGNTTETLEFFRELQDCVERRHRKVFLDMTASSIIDMDALLYVLSLFDRFHLRGIPCHIGGNVPKNQNCLKLLISSGFFQYVQARMPNTPPDKHIFRIVSGDKTETKTAGCVVDFALGHLKKSQSQHSRAIYRILIEMMNNTREHAYVRKEKTSKWHLMARYDKDSNTVSFAFLDGGQGVPTTVSKNYGERVTQLLKPMLDRAPGVRSLSSLREADALLLKSALEGGFRTRTGKQYRGEGMPEINGLARKGFLGDLRLVSGNGCVDCNDGTAIGLDSKFEGTLYTWKFL